MSDEILTVEANAGVAWITLNRPNTYNALNIDLAEALAAAARRCDEDPTVRAVVLTGAGSAFCAGGDLRSFAAAGRDIGPLLERVTNALHAAIVRFARMQAPVIAAVNGAAAGAGMSLACATDLTIAAGPTPAFGTVKTLLMASPFQELEPQLAAEAEGIIAMANTTDGRAGIAAFLEKRRPSFQGK